MLAGVEVASVAFSFFIRCDLRGLLNEIMLTVAVFSLVVDESPVVWSCGHQCSFSSPFSHCVRSSVEVSSSVGLMAVMQTFVWGARLRRCRGSLLVFAGSVALSWGCCWGAIRVRVVSCFLVAPAWGWLVAFAVALLLPVGIGTCGSWAMFSFSV